MTDTNMIQLENNTQTLFISPPLVHLQTSTPYSNSSYVHWNCELSSLACGVRNSLPELLKQLRNQRLLFLVFHISPEAEVAWSEVRRSRGQGKGPARPIQVFGKFSSKKGSHGPLTVIAVASVAEVSQSILPSEFPPCYTCICSTLTSYNSNHL
jgi:hypothetical protein